MFGATKGGGVLDRQGLSSSSLSRALLAAAGNEFDLDGGDACIRALKLLPEEASSRTCVNGAAAAAAEAAAQEEAAAAISIAN